MKKVLKLKLVAVIAALMLLLLAVTVAYAGGGHTADQLKKAGWACMNAGPFNWTHCFPPSTDPSGAPATIQVKVFGKEEEEGDLFLGTELLIREDLYRGQPCPQDGGGPYDEHPFLPYYACHHFDRGHH